MSLIFGASEFKDPALGMLRRKGGKWRGKIAIDGNELPLVLDGSRNEPDVRALETARTLPTRLTAWQPSIERALFEHHEPYADESPFSFAQPADVWPHTTIQYLHVGAATIEIGLSVAWDEEHTLGARFTGDELVELNGSVLAT